MALLVYSVVNRHMKNVERFAKGAALPFAFDGEGEGVLGWYTNPPPFEDDVVVFTESALHAKTRTGWLRIPFEDIERCEVPRSKQESDGVRLRTRTGIAFIRFAGRSGPEGKFSDAFSLVGLLQAVVVANTRSRKRPV